MPAFSENGSARGNGPNDVPRDGYGRYLIPRYPLDGPMAADAEPIPGDGMAQPWTRVSTVAGATEDGFGIAKWQARMQTKGMGARPDLVALAAATRLDDKAGLDDIAEQARDAAAIKASANLGTALHAFTDQVDAGETPFIPAPWDADITAYTAALAKAGVSLIPGMQELRVVHPAYQVGKAAGVAGTFDRIVMWKGQPTVADLKTGSNPLLYGGCKIAIQLWFYATAWAIWDGASFRPLPAGLRQDKALVIHLPAGSGKAVVEEVFLNESEEAAELAIAVMEWRKRGKHLHRPVVVAENGAAKDVLLTEERETPSAYLAGQATRAAVVEENPYGLDPHDYATKQMFTDALLAAERRAAAGISDAVPTSTHRKQVSYPNRGSLGHAEELDSAVVSGPGAPGHATAQGAAGLDALGQPLAPLAVPPERGCGVCGRKGHRRNNVKCLGTADPAAASNQPAEELPVWTPGATEPPAVPCAHGAWSRNPLTGDWECGVCEAPAAPHLQVEFSAAQDREQAIQTELSDGDHDTRASAVAAVDQADPFEDDNPSVTDPKEQDWHLFLDRIAAAKDKAELRAIRGEATDLGVWDDQLFQAGLDRLKVL